MGPMVVSLISGSVHVIMSNWDCYTCDTKLGYNAIRKHTKLGHETTFIYQRPRKPKNNTNPDYIMNPNGTTPIDLCFHIRIFGTLTGDKVGEYSIDFPLTCRVCIKQFQIQLEV